MSLLGLLDFLSAATFTSNLVFMGVVDNVFMFVS